MMFHHPENIRVEWLRYRSWCWRQCYRWLPYRRWLTEVHVACLLDHP